MFSTTCDSANPTSKAGWESDNKGFERKRGWVVCSKSCATFSVLFDAKTTTVEQITL